MGLPEVPRRSVDSLLNVDGLETGDAGEKQRLEGCNCGHGWCEVHGTHDLPAEDEATAAMLKQLRGTTRGGRRVVRRNPPSADAS